MTRAEKDVLLKDKDYSKALGVMLKYNIDAIEMAKLYESLRKDSKTTISQKNIMLKVAGLLEYFVGNRNVGLNQKQKAYITKEDLFRIIYKYPKIVSLEDITTRGRMVDEVLKNNKAATNIALKKDSYIYSTGIDKLYKSLAILSNFSIVLNSKEEIGLAEYVMQRNQTQLQNSAEKLFFRLQYIRMIIGSNHIEQTDFNRSMKAKKDFERINDITDEELAEAYPLPPYDPEHRDVFTRSVREQLTNKTKKIEDEQWAI